MEWRDPNTGQLFVVDKRTGNSVIQLDHTVGDNETDDGATKIERRRNLVDTSALRQRPASAGPQSQQPEWMNALFEGWQNPTFQTGQRQLTSTAPTPNSEDPFIDHSCCNKRGTPSHIRCNRRTSVSHEDVSFTRDDLRSARVLGQVDAQFIACVLPPDPGTVVLVDQHAADERVRVERFLRELCEGYARFAERAVAIGSAAKPDKSNTAGPPRLWLEEPVTVFGHATRSRSARSGYALLCCV